MAPSNMFWGDRFGKFTDPFGHQWGVATHVEDVAPEEMKRRSRGNDQADGQSRHSFQLASVPFQDDAPIWITS